jgi:hypothetical protein
MTAPTPATTPENALRDLAAGLREEDTVISTHVREPEEAPVLGLLVAAGPRTVEAPAEYAFVIEAIREGYLLHYARPRVLGGADGDLSLLAGDYLYALGLERLAAMADIDAVRELSDLISLQALLHGEAAGAGPEAADALWLASTIAVAAGAGDAHTAAKKALRDGDSEAARELAQVASDTAAEGGIEGAFQRCTEAMASQ